MIENYLKRSEMKDITVRELLKRYPDRGYIVWYGDLWLLDYAELRPLKDWEESVLDYKVKNYIERQNGLLSIDVK